MNWSGDAWTRSKTPAKSSLIQTPFTLARKSAKKHWFRAVTRDSVRRVSRLGSRSPQHKFRRLHKSDHRYRRVALDRASSNRGRVWLSRPPCQIDTAKGVRVMKRESDIAMEH